jgi:hypothetical protein
MADHIKPRRYALYSLICGIAGIICAFVLLPLANTVGYFISPIAMTVGSLASLVGTVSGVIAITELLKKKTGGWFIAVTGLITSLVSLVFFVLLFTAIRNFN